MTWNRNVPQGTDKQSIFPPQNRDNMDYLENHINAEHRFTATADPLSGTDGRHKFVQMISLAAAPVLDPNAKGRLYGLTHAGYDGIPAYQIISSTEEFRVPVCISFVKAGLAQGAHVIDLYDFALKTVPTFVGTALIYPTGSPDKSLLSTFIWDAAGATVYCPNASGQLKQTPGGTGSMGKFVGTGTKLQLDYDYSPGAAFSVRVVITGVFG